MTLVKQRGNFPSMRALLEDFWNTDTLLDDRFFGRSTTLPAVNIREQEDSFMIELAAPGLKKEDFKISVDNGVLQIESETRKEEEEKNDTFTRKEFSYSSFSRSFSIPENASEDNVTANYENGVLKLKLGKLKKDSTHKKKQIQIG